MASLPLNPASRRRSEQMPAAPQAPADSSSTVDSPQPVLLTDPQFQSPSSSSSSNSSATQQQTTPEQPAAEERRCWICQGDANEDETPKEWRSPCPCSLTAHNSCLLEWVSAEEAPKNGELAGTTHAIVCPQCKAHIKIERPFDPLVVYTEHIQRAAKALILPTALSAVIGCFYSGFLVYGVNTMHIVFGEERATQIMMRDRGVDSNLPPQWQTYGLILRDLVRSMDPFFPTADKLSKTNWKLFVGLPFIAPSLVLMRLNLGEKIFNLIPTAYFVTHLAFNSSNGFNALEWPPKPSLAFAVIPYLRSFYNEVYRVTFADLEKKWDAAVQRRPRDGETAEQIVAEQVQQVQFGGGGGGGLDVDIEVELNIWGGVEEEVPAADAPLQEAPALAPLGEDGDEWVDEDGDAAPPLVDDAALPLVDDAAPPLVGDPAAAPGDAPRNRNRNRGLRNDFSSVTASTIMGALFFPAISSAIGDIIAATLPTKWISGMSKRGSSGLLQEKWGRTIVGGCLFVVLKDALVLYCKWKKARDFGKMKILDYVGQRGRPAV